MVYIGQNIGSNKPISLKLAYLNQMPLKYPPNSTESYFYNGNFERIALDTGPRGADSGSDIRRPDWLDQDPRQLDYWRGFITGLPAIDGLRCR
jgi:hypothetical protein